MTGQYKAITLAVEYWRKQNVGLRPPAQVADVMAAFSLFQQIPARDVVELYQILDGFADHQYCQNHWSLWSLEEIRTENKYNQTTDIWFADYLINSHYFSLHTEDQCTSSVYVQYPNPDGQTEAFKVTDSLEQFLLLLVNDPESVYVFPPGKTDTDANDSQSPNWWRTVRGWLPF